MAAAPSKIEALALFRSLLRTARQFSDYNIREYAKLDGFRANRSLTDSNTITPAYVDGKNHLEIAKRQAVVYSLYAPKELLKRLWLSAHSVSGLLSDSSSAVSSTASALSSFETRKIAKLCKGKLSSLLSRRNNDCPFSKLPAGAGYGIPGRSRFSPMNVPLVLSRSVTYSCN
ncbi:hypothetical protein ACFE04_006506 [Oxalis oulophora]